MSTVPPVPPGSVPPPPPPPPSAGVPRAPLPWEMRQHIGFGQALVETVKLLVTAPQEAWSRTKGKGDILEPLLFGVILSWVGLVFSSVYGMFFGAAWLRYVPEAYRGRLGPFLGGGAASFVVHVVLGPIAIAIFLFIGAAILHACFMIVGALSGSTAGFEGTFRVVCYSSVAALAQIIPVMGGPIAGVWRLVLTVLGAVALHRTTTGKAVFGVLLPLVLCCLCGVAAFGFLGSLIFGALHR